MLSIIVAFDRNQVIGYNNQMPWHYKDDLAYFKATTLGKKVVMGKKTFQSILDYNKKPLQNRENILISSSCGNIPQVECFSDIDSFLAKYLHSKEELFVIGGASIYRQLLPYCERLYITHIDKEYIGDTYFPTINYSDYLLVKSEKKGELTFSLYQRKDQRNE